MKVALWITTVIHLDTQSVLRDPSDACGGKNIEKEKRVRRLFFSFLKGSPRGSYFASRPCSCGGLPFGGSSLQGSRFNASQVLIVGK